MKFFLVGILLLLTAARASWVWEGEEYGSTLLAVGRGDCQTDQTKKKSLIDSLGTSSFLFLFLSCLSYLTAQLGMRDAVTNFVFFFRR